MLLVNSVVGSLFRFPPLEQPLESLTVSRKGLPHMAREVKNPQFLVEWVMREAVVSVVGPNGKRVEYQGPMWCKVPQDEVSTWHAK